jgi:hypothetical protein
MQDLPKTEKIKKILAQEWFHLMLGVLLLLWLIATIIYYIY